MRKKLRWTSLTLAGVMACTVHEPLAPDATRLVAASALSATAGCYSVKADFSGAPTGQWTVSGVLTGDLEGTLTVNFDPGSVTFAGATIHNSGTAQWVITGGILPVPLAFETSFDNANIFVDRPGSPAEVFENIGSHRALSGVTTANMNYRGTFTVALSVLADHHYQGVVCP